MRLLKAREIECRVKQVNPNGVSLLLYKDARCDMAILDEEFGADRWQRKHELIDGNLYCSVGIKYGDEWIWKQDVGTESNTEKEKGQASDSFKRACFNVGIGRELYTAPFIWVGSDKCKIEDKKCKTRFEVSSVEYNEFREISALTICDANTGKVVYYYGNGGNARLMQEPEQKPEPKPEPEAKPENESKCTGCGCEITDTESGGKTYTAAQIIAISMKRHNAIYCCKCMAEMRKQ